MVRRRVAAGVGVVLLIVIVLVVNGCLKSQRTQALKDYNRNVSLIATESVEQVSNPLFSTLNGAAGKSALNVEEQVDQLRIQAQSLANRAKALSVPGEMAAAQRNFTLAMNLRVEGVTKVAALLPTALGANGKQALHADRGRHGDLPGLRRDLLPAGRPADPADARIKRDSRPEQRLPAASFPTSAGSNRRRSRRASPASRRALPRPVTGNHGSALKGTSVGTNTLETEPTLNHITGGGSPTFTVQVENSGEFPETNVKVDVTVTAGGKQFKASHAIEKTEPGKTVSVDIPVAGVPLGVASKIETYIETVPGENDAENNKGNYLAIFEQ